MDNIIEKEIYNCFQSNRNICFVPVRKNSKEIKGKNMQVLAGKPLVPHILETIILSEIADEIWVATDWDNLKSYVNETFGQKVKVYDRNPENATVTSHKIDVVMEFIERNNYAFSDNLIHFQATYPFTTYNELIELNSILKIGSFESVISCCRLKRFRWSTDGVSLDYNIKKKLRRQDYKGFLIESGSFYVSKISLIQMNRLIILSNTKKIYVLIFIFALANINIKAFF